MVAEQLQEQAACNYFLELECTAHQIRRQNPHIPNYNQGLRKPAGCLPVEAH